MQLNNPLQMNDWGINKFLKVVVAIQLAMWGVIGLDAIGLQIPIVRQVVGFIYLTFVPGIVILRILKLHKLGNIETLMYTVGLSIATLMFTGLLMNTVYPLFGISGPISITPLIITISVVVLVLCVLSYIRDKDFSNPSFIDVRDVLSPPALFLCLIPFLAIFGTYLVNFHHNNILLMFLIIILALIVILIAFDKFIPKNLYPLAVFVIAISLLYHRWLISMYLGASDVHIEYYLCNLVEMNGIWDSTMPSAYNAMLSLVMLAPFYSIISNMDMIWVFKIIYPLFYSLVPLGLYRVFQKQIGDKIAFLSCFFFISFWIFWIVSSRRQWIAGFFLVLLILAMIDKDMNKIKRSFLFIAFGVSLAVSHYGTSYIYMFCLISAWLILVSSEYPWMQKLMNNFYFKFGRKREKPTGNPVSLKVDRTISSTFIILFIVFTLTWYMYVSSSSAFNAIVRIGDHVASSIFTDFLNPEAAQGWGIIMKKTVSPLHSVFKYLHLLFQFFIAVGVLTLMLNREETKFEKEYEAFSLLFFAICLGGIALPHFASALNVDRLYHITLIFLAPFCVIGGITVFRMLSKIVKTSWTEQHVRSSLKVLSVFFAIFLLFNTGWVYEVTKDHPGSLALSQGWIKEYGAAKTKVGFYGGFVPEQNVFGIQWLSGTINRENIKIRTDTLLHSRQITGYGSIPEKFMRLSLDNTTKIRSGEYVYLGYLNVVEGLLRSIKSKYLERTVYYNISEISPLLEEMYKIYTNGGSEIYYRDEK